MNEPPSPHGSPQLGAEAVEAVRRFAEAIAEEAGEHALTNTGALAEILSALAPACRETAETAASMADEVDEAWEPLADSLAETAGHLRDAAEHADQAAAAPIVRRGTS